MIYLMIDSEFDALQKLTPQVDVATLQAFQDSTRAAIAENQGATAVIDIKGVLTEQPNMIASFMSGGNTAYSDIRNALTAAEDDSDIKDIQLNIDSGGGTVAGLFYTIDYMRAVNKPINAVVSNMAASAAYAIAAAADTIEATNEGALFGCIGTAKSFVTNTNTVTLTNSESPAKIPDVTTQEGKETAQRELDSIYALFADKIATGRQTTVSNINKSYGKGAVLLADDALNRGMIDKLSTVVLNNNETLNITTIKAQAMNLHTLKAEHSALYAAVFALGIAEEKERVDAHLKLGKELDAMTVAIKAIEAGSTMTPLVVADYTLAGINKTDINKRLSDNEEITISKTAVDDNLEARKAPLMLALAAEKLQIDLPEEHKLSRAGQDELDQLKANIDKAGLVNYA